MRTREELNAPKSEVEALEKKLAGLTDKELKTVTGGYESERRRYWPSISRKTTPPAKTEENN